MSLEPGRRIGPYEVVAAIGAGGMGEVYRARDTKLGRDVALKILPDSFAGDPDRLARFSREAQVLASLNHQNIAAIYGLEDSGAVHALVLELVDGPTLEDRLAAGPLAAADALEIATQVCDALSSAHERNIIHRDLKPANIKLRADGVVKVLDFGLAKLAEATRDTAVTAISPAAPTGMITGVGVILGTAAYMSPEQAKGLEADRRSDIWAFGCLLYEMLVGRRPFQGPTTTELLAAILHNDPDWNALPRQTSPVIVRLLRRCLQKDPRKRLHDLADAKLDIEDAAAGPAADVAVPAAVRRGPANWPWLMAIAAVIASALATWMLTRPAPAAAGVPMRLMVTLPPATTIGFSRGSAIALSPDGSLLAYTAGEGTGPSRLYFRPIDRLQPALIEGSDGAANPFFSPDGQWVAFFADGKIKKVRASGGSATSIAPAANPRGEAWGPDDNIYFTPKNNASIWRVPATGGQPEAVTTLGKGEFSHRWPQILPGGKAILFTIWNDTGFEGGRVAVQRLGTTTHEVIVPGAGYPRYVGPDSRGGGYLMYAQADGVLAAPFDLDRLAISGPSFRVLDNVITNLSGGAHFTTAANGMLAFLPGALGEIDREIAWFDRSGKAETVKAIHGMSLTYRLSPDGRRVVRLNVLGTSRDMWIEELDRGTTTRFSVDTYNFSGTWSPDGQWLAFGTAGQAAMNLFRKRADGTGKEERLTTGPNNQAPCAWTPDGRTLIFVENNPESGSDLWTIDVDGDRKPKPFLQTPFSETSASISPDGKWIAYQSNETGRFEIYVTSFPNAGRKWQVSTEGGFLPAWAHSGRELFYQVNGAMMAAAISTQGELKADRPRVLFAGRFNGDTNVSPDDQRFLLLKGQPQETSASQIYIVLNWFDELRRLTTPAR